jgi:hypothetical protein
MSSAPKNADPFQEIRTVLDRYNLPPEMRERLLLRIVGLSAGQRMQPIDRAFLHPLYSGWKAAANEEWVLLPAEPAGRPVG